MKPLFFFDTADEGYIETVWEKLNGVVDPRSVAGITTNPNALAKVGCNTLAELDLLIPELCRLVTRIRRGESGGIVYVQTPNSVMASGHIFEWARYVKNLTDGTTDIGLKIPHFSSALELTPGLHQMGLHVNVTGIADWGTVVKALSYPGVTYASIIPGRMAERGIDANSHLDTLALIPRLPHQAIIAGSMRTVDGLIDAIRRQTVPTIGTRVWDAILADDHWYDFPSWWGMPTPATTGFGHEPLVTEENRKLSVEFFQQMDALGQPLFVEFMSR